MTTTTGPAGDPDASGLTWRTVSGAHPRADELPDTIDALVDLVALSSADANSVDACGDHVGTAIVVSRLSVFSGTETVA